MTDAQCIKNAGGCRAGAKQNVVTTFIKGKSGDCVTLLTV
jgi:hypothetical protein